MSEPGLLIGDLGGTNARFALAEPDGAAYTRVLTLPCSDYETPESAISTYLQSTGAGLPRVICIAAAGPIVDGVAKFLNNDWTLDSRKLTRMFPSASVSIMNDFEANAWCIPMLGKGDVETIGLTGPDIEGRDAYSVGVLGPGTGLGVAGLVCREGNALPVTGEGGHGGFAPENRTQMAVLKQMRARFERVSNERLLSGQGLQNIHDALLAIHGMDPEPLSPGEIYRRALDHSDVVASETLQLFYEVFGQVAGNLALTLGAWDGIYIAGGIVRRYPDLLKTSGFRSGFENKGRYRSIMENIPTALITHEQPGLLGASHCARQMTAEPAG